MKKDDDKIIEELLKEHPLDNMVNFSELDISDKLTENTRNIVKYRDFYHKELNHLDKLDDLLEKLTGLRYKHYRFEDNHGWTKVEIEKYALPADKQIQRMKRIIRKQRIRVRFFEMAWKAFEKQSWNMKMFLETLKNY